jgi:site-specific DNA-methyltransferase (adenine-specific)
MAVLVGLPDDYFDLAIVDPPYGILSKTKRGGDKKFNMAEYTAWDIRPQDEYFVELQRVSKNQIVWGGNYFPILWTTQPTTRCFVVWDKKQPEALNNFSMGELAWTSFDRPAKIFEYSVRRNRGKIHPTQKPVALYEWLLRMFAKPGMKILDTHLGSGTIGVACSNSGYSLVGIEISSEYVQKATEFIKAEAPNAKVTIFKTGKFSQKEIDKVFN